MYFERHKRSGKDEQWNWPFKRNLPTDANHVSAKDRAYQKRTAEKNSKSVMVIEDKSKKLLLKQKELLRRK